MWSMNKSNLYYVDVPPVTEWVTELLTDWQTAWIARVAIRH